MIMGLLELVQTLFERDTCSQWPKCNFETTFKQCGLLGIFPQPVLYTNKGLQSI